MSATPALRPADLEFVPMTTADLDAVHAIEQRVHAFPWTRGNFADCLVSGYGAWLLSVDGELTGYAVLALALDEAELLDIGIAAARQRAGLGSRFMAFLFEEARSSGAGRMFLEVRESNRAARALYQRCGFAQVGLRRDYYATNDGREPALVLARDL